MRQPLLSGKYEEQRDVIALGRGAGMRLSSQFSHLTDLLLTSNPHLVTARSGEI